MTTGRTDAPLGAEFWNDLNSDLQSPEFAREFALQSVRIATIDAIINQDVGHEVRSAVRVLMAKADKLPLIESQERIRIDIFMRDNLP